MSARHILQTKWIPSHLPFCLQGLAYFDEYYQQIHVCLFLIWYFNEKLKIKRLLEVNSKSCRVSEQCSIFWKFFTLLLACSMWIRGKATCCVCTTSSGTNSSNAKMITCLLSTEKNFAVTWSGQFCTSQMLFHNQYSGGPRPLQHYMRLMHGNPP